MNLKVLFVSLTAGRADCPHIHVSDNNDNIIISMFGVIALSVLKNTGYVVSDQGAIGAW